MEQLATVTSQYERSVGGMKLAGAEPVLQGSQAGAADLILEAPVLELEAVRHGLLAVGEYVALEVHWRRAGLEIGRVEASHLEHVAAEGRDDDAAGDQRRADLAVAVTGVAGPGGGSAEKPVGLVHLAVARAGREPRHREMRYGDIGRSHVRAATVHTALEMLGEAIET